jgi:hypothetical protein
MQSVKHKLKMHEDFNPNALTIHFLQQMQNLI